MDGALGRRLAALGATCALVACGSSSTRGAALDDGVTEVADAGPASDAAGGGDAPITDAGSDATASTDAERALAWLLGVLNGAPLGTAEVTARFTASFLAAVPAATLVSTLAAEVPHAPWVRVGTEGTPSDDRLTALVTRGDGQRWRIVLATSAGDQGRIEGLLLAPAGDTDPALADWPKIDAALGQLAARVDLLAASVDDTACTELHALNGASSLAIGSAFKLWILAALADDVGAGRRAWTDLVTVRDDWKSLPSGDLQTAPAGSTISLRDAAGKMIAISDNTAADHLVFTLGRETVEAAFTSTGHHDPSLNVPLFTTRELFDLKLLLSPADQAAYFAASVSGKRAALASWDATLDPRTWTGTWTTPRLIDQAEWFATPGDLCAVMRALKVHGDAAATAAVRDVLSANPGLGDVRGDFDWIGYKGGSEPGVLDLTWLVRRRSDGTYRFLSIGLNDDARDPSTDAALYVAEAARALLAR